MGENDCNRNYFQEIKKQRGFELVSYAPEGARKPERKTKGSSCYDFYLCDDVYVPARGHTDIIPLYVKAYMRKDEVLKLHIRSSVGLVDHVTLANNTGIIDSDYYNNPKNEGNIGIVLQNNTDQDIFFDKGDRVVQGMFEQFLLADDDIVTEERIGGTGSTGK